MLRRRYISRQWRRYSFAVKTEAVKICAVTLALLFLAAAQDLAPAVSGAKPPLLLLFGCVAGVPAAVSAGLFTDALSGLPFGCSVAFYIVSALLIRALRRCAFLIAVLSAALYQVWLAVWGGDSPMRSAIAAFAFAAVLYPAVCAALRSAKRLIGINGSERDNAE